MARQNIINHCSKWIPTEKEFKYTDYPEPGQSTHIWAARCPQGKHNAYAIQTTRQNGTQTDIINAPRPIRKELDKARAAGLWVEIEIEAQPKTKRPRKGGSKKPTRHTALVGDYTRGICRPADANIFRLRRVVRWWWKDGIRNPKRLKAAKAASCFSG